jgi:hypothetical protein
MLEVRFDAVLGAAESCLEGGHKWILADLNQARSSGALLMNYRRAAGNQRLFGDSIEIARPALNIRAGFVELIPSYFWKGETLLRFNRFCFYSLHILSTFLEGSRMCSRFGPVPQLQARARRVKA